MLSRMLWASRLAAASSRPALAARLAAASAAAVGLSTASTRPALADGSGAGAAVVVGVSHAPGLGFAVAKRFAQGGLAVGLVGRQQDRLEECRRKILEEVPNAQIAIQAADATDAKQVQQAFGKLEAAHGPASVLVFNMSCRPFPPTTLAELDPNRLESDWRTGPLAALLCAQAVLPSMMEAGRGTILISGASASLRGTERFGSFGAAKSSLRAMAQSLAKELAPHRIHVAHVIVDAMVDMPVINSFFPDAPPGRLLDTTDAAEVYWQLYQQSPPCMTFECDVRPFEAKW